MLSSLSYSFTPTRGHLEAHSRDEFPMGISWKGFSEDVSYHITSWNIGDNGLSFSNNIISYKVKFAFNVHGASAVLRIFGKDDGCLIVAVEFGGTWLRMTQFFIECSEPHEMLTSIAKSDIL